MVASHYGLVILLSGVARSSNVGSRRQQPQDLLRFRVPGVCGLHAFTPEQTQHVVQDDVTGAMRCDVCRSG